MTRRAIPSEGLASARLAEARATELGQVVMNRLRRLDKVAYVRFASVYLDFKDVREFMDELKDLLKAKGK